jgi:hypothetical protein
MLHVLKDLNVYLVKFKDYLNEKEGAYIDAEKLETIYLINFHLCLDYIEGDDYSLFIISDEHGIDNFKIFLDDNKIPYICNDVSNKILIGKLDIKQTIYDNLDEFNCEISDLFLEEIDNWIYQNINIDIILDKISEKGIQSLTDVEKKYLDNF